MALVAAEEPIPVIDHVAISGAVLASLLSRFNSAAGDSDGLLLGRLSLLPSAAPADDHDPSSPAGTSPSSLSSAAAVITDIISPSQPCSFADPLGRVDAARLRLLISSATGAADLLGWFSARRRSALRPSMREVAISASLSKVAAHSAPCLFILLTSSSSSNRAIHNYDYRAYVLHGSTLEPRSMRIVNLGPGFAGQFADYSTFSALPLLSYQVKPVDGREMRRGASSKTKQAALDQQLLDLSAEGVTVEQLEKMVSPMAGSFTKEQEDLFGGMLQRLKTVARQAEKSSLRVLEQENKNLLLRSKLAGLE